MELNFRTDITKWLNKLEPLEPENTGYSPELKSGKPAKAVIFDIYGTLLISSSGDIDQATWSTGHMKKALIAGGYMKEQDSISLPQFMLDKLPETIAANHRKTTEKGHPFPDVDIFKVWDEMITEAETKNLVKLSGDESPADSIIVFELLSNKVSPMPGMKEIVQELEERHIPIGIVSNAQFYTPVIMNWFMTGEFTTNQEIAFFNSDLTVFSYKELRAKPDVELFGRIVPALKNNYGIEPSEALFIGNDVVKDMYTAHKAGFKTVLFAGDKRSLRLHPDDPRSGEVNPDYIITRLEQILQLVS